MPEKTSKITCWCGNTNLTRFSLEYLHCSNCETLIIDQDQLIPIDIVNDEHDFYGKQYWFEHMKDDLGFENIVTRARMDIPERVLYWLQTLLKYQLPPAKTIEIGCSHGGFVAALSWSGFDSIGLELSPWVVNFARKTFGITILEGKLEEQRLEPASFDTIILMDVLEHLTQPKSTMQFASGLLKPGGIFIVQTPCYPEGKQVDDLTSVTHPFLEQLKPPEHLFLFSERSIQKLFSEIGCDHVVFEQPIFSQYDMFVIASKQELKINDQSQIEERLLGLPSGRMVQALIDLNAIHENTKTRLRIAEEDREARLKVIREQGDLSGKIEAEKNNLALENKYLKKQMRKLEKDRAARLEVIHEQGGRLGQIEAERNNLAFENVDLQEQFRLSEEDRAARLEVIHEQGERLGQREAERNNLAFENEAIKEQFRLSEEDRAARLEIINKQAIQYDELMIKYDQRNKEKKTDTY